MHALVIKHADSSKEKLLALAEGIPGAWTGMRCCRLSFNPDYALGRDEDDESIETERGAQ